MALLHISRVFLFFAMLSVATLGLQTFTENRTHGEMTGTGFLVSNSGFALDWLANEQSDTRSFFLKPVGLLSALAGVAIWIGFLSTPRWLPARLRHEPQQAPRPPPGRLFGN